MKYFSGILLVLASLALSQASLIRSQECSKGITYWCKHVMNAKKCNAVDFCIQTVWTKHNVEYDSNPLCDDCKDWVKQARDFLANDKPFDVIIKSLEWSCQICPDKAGCRKIIEDNIHEIQKIIVSAMNPDAVCSAIHFCNNKRFTELYKKQKNQKFENGLLPFTCGQCSQIAGLIESNLKKASNDDTLEGLLSICGQASSFSDSCSSLVLTNFDEIKRSLLKIINRQRMCHATCSLHHNDANMDVQVSFDDPDIPCQMCQQLMLHLRELLITNTTEVEFKDMLEGFCAQMPSITDECINIVEQYYDSIYKFLENGLDADKTCVMIKMCKAAENVEQFKAPKMPLITSDLFPKPKKVIHSIADDSTMKLYENGALCTACEYTMQLVHQEVTKKTVHNEILNRAKSACSSLPMYQRECVDLIEMFGDQILEAIDLGTDPRLICPFLHMCPPSFDFNYLHHSRVGDKPSCPFCLFAMQELKDVVSSNSTKETISGYVSKLCTHLPSNLKDECVDFVKTYESQVVDMILADFTPQEACVFIKLCSNSKPKLERIKLPASLSRESSESADFLDFDDSTEIKSKLVNNPQCDLCKSLIKILEERVIDHKSKDEIRRELENSCARMRKFSKECKAFVDKFSDRIVDLVSKELEPEHVCKELLFCVTINYRDLQDYDFGLDIIMKSYNTPSVELTGLKDSPQCQYCKSFVNEISELIKANKTKDEVRSTLDDYCSHLYFQPLIDQCKSFVDKYSDNIYDLVHNGLDTEKVCQSLYLCTINENALSNDVPIESEEVDGASTGCVLCEFIADKLEEELNNKKTDEAIKHTVKNICSKMPQTVARQCNQFIDYYFDMIIALIETTKPSEICQAIKVCEKNLAVLEAQVTVIKQDIYTCAVCRGVVESLDTIIEDPNVDTNLENLEEKICEKFSGKFKDKCHNLASTYGIAIINLLKSVAESDSICYQLKLCNMAKNGLTGSVTIL